MSEDDKFNKGRDSSGQQHPSAPPQYGTFPPPSDYPPPPPPPPPPQAQPPTGFPQPVPPPGAAEPPPPDYYAHGYQAVPGYPVAEGRPVRQRRLCCCGLGWGWCLFILGFFSAVPWYVGAIILLCCRIDYREKPGLIACTIAAGIATIAIIAGATKEAHVW